jgi:hypothetical protein
MVLFMDNGRHPEIARRAALEPLASDSEKDSAAKHGLMLAARLLKKVLVSQVLRNSISGNKGYIR